MARSTSLNPQEPTGCSMKLPSLNPSGRLPPKASSSGS